MITKFRAILASISILSLVGLVRATTTYFAGGAVGNLGGPLGLVVDLGIENVPGVTVQMAYFYYRWICFALIMWVALTADKRSSTVFCVLATGIAAMTAYFGWFTVTYSDGVTLNPAGPWGLIILCALLTVASYMTETKRVNFGISGAGDPIINLFTFFIIFQGVIGLLNGAAIFPAGTPGIPNTPQVCTATAAVGTNNFGNNNFGNCQVNGAAQLQSMQTNTQTQSILGGVFDALTTAALMSWNAILLVIQIACSLAFVGGVILASYPWIATSGSAMALLGLFQFGIWMLYILMLFRWIGKSMPGEGRL
jgi:hypothetical protein